MSVAKGTDELWVGVKCQSNLAIAGSPRNALRGSLVVGAAGGRALERRGGFPLTNSHQTPNAGQPCHGSETAGAKIRRRKGNNPDHRLRSPSVDSVGKEVRARRQPGGWLRSSHP